MAYTRKSLGTDTVYNGSTVQCVYTYSAENISVSNGKITFTMKATVSGSSMWRREFFVKAHNASTYTQYYFYDGHMQETITLDGYIADVQVHNGAVVGQVFPPLVDYVIDPLEGGVLSISLSGTFANNNLKSVATYTNVFSALSYNITYSIGTKTETSTGLKASATKNFDTSWYDGLPTSTSGTLTVTGTVRDNGTVIQTVNKTLAVTIPDSVKPSISAFTIADRLTTVPSAWGIYVQGLSAVRINTLTYSSPYATVTEIQLKCGTATTKTGTPSNYPVGDVLTQTGTVPVTVTVKDARGRTATSTINITVYAYSAPSFTSARSERCDSDGALDDEGTRFKVTTAISYSDCNGNNSITLTVAIKPSTSSSYGAAQTIAANASVVATETISANASYDVRLTLTDQFNTSYHYDYISTALYLMHFMTGGNGIAFGQKANIADMFDCNFQATFRKGVTFTKSGGGTVTIQQIIDALGL